MESFKSISISCKALTNYWILEHSNSFPSLVELSTPIGEDIRTGTMTHVPAMKCHLNLSEGFMEDYVSMLLKISLENSNWSLQGPSGKLPTNQLSSFSLLSLISAPAIMVVGFNKSNRLLKPKFWPTSQIRTGSFWELSWRLLTSTQPTSLSCPTTIANGVLLHCIEISTLLQFQLI